MKTPSAICFWLRDHACTKSCCIYHCRPIASFDSSSHRWRIFVATTNTITTAATTAAANAAATTVVDVVVVVVDDDVAVVVVFVDVDMI